MEESLQHTLVLAQRTADEVKAAAHTEADLIKREARMHAEREVADLGDRISESRREYQHALDTAAQAKSELRSLLMSHLSLIDRPPAPHEIRHSVAAAALAAAGPAPAAPPAATAPAPPPDFSDREIIISEHDVDPLPEPEPPPVLIRNGVTHTLVK
jgi:cell division septum initiation protein DivIVA